MPKECVVVACALCCAPALVKGANIEYRLVEVTGQTIANGADPILDFAIQGRVSGGGGLASWYFDSIQLVGDAESRATFGRDRISNTDGTYYSGVPQTNNSVGLGGVARQYAFLAMVNSNFNGLFNTSGGTFTNTPDNEIGGPSGFAAGAGLLGTPGVDVDMDNRPDTIPTPATLGTLAPAVMGPYFAQDQFIDLYRFRVTFTDLSSRAVLVRLNGPRGESFTQVSLATDGSAWGALRNTGDTISAANLTVQVVPGPSAALGLAGVLGLGVRRRRAR